MESAQRRGAKTVDYLKSEIALRRQTPLDDYLTRLFDHEAEDGRKWNDEEVLGHCFNLFLGGLDTVTTMLGNIFMHLARYPEQQRELREHPERIVLAVEEFLRVYGPVTAFRIAACELELHGQKIMPGEYVSVATPVINQDPKLHDNPSQVRFDRKAAHVAAWRGHPQVPRHASGPVRNADCTGGNSQGDPAISASRMGSSRAISSAISPLCPSSNCSGIRPLRPDACPHESVTGARRRFSKRRLRAGRFRDTGRSR